MIAPLWSFSHTVNSERATKLLSYRTYSSVIALVAQATVEAFAWEPFTKDALRGCRRPSFILRIDPDIYDAFFNAPTGYRAQYARGPANGEAANRMLLWLLQDALIAFAQVRATVCEGELLWSLCGSESKIWINEQEAEDQLGATEPALIYLPWQENSETGVGLLAPRATQLVVKGAWLDPTGAVCANPLKAKRSEDIYLTGYS